MSKELEKLVKIASELERRTLFFEADKAFEIIATKIASELEITPDTPILSEEGADEYYASLTPSTEDESPSDYTASSPSSSPEEKLLELIRGSEEIARRLGLEHSEAEMTAEDLEKNLRKVLNLEGLSEDEMDSVITLAIKLVSSPMQMLGGTPRVKVTP